MSPEQAKAELDSAEELPISQGQITFIAREVMSRAAEESVPGRGRHRNLPTPLRRILGRAAIPVAAVLLLGVGALWWSRGTSNGVAWAEVASRMAGAKTVTFWMEPHYANPQGDTGHLRWFREYHSDPGWMRREYYDGPVPPEQEQSPLLWKYQIRRIAGPAADEHHIYPLEQRAWHEVTRDYWYSEPNQVADWWQRLGAITSDATREVGREQLGDVSTVVFKAVGKKLWGPPWRGSADTPATLRIWVDTTTSFPVRIRFLGRSSDGTTVEQTMEDVRWNVQFPDDFFDVPQGFEIIEGATRVYLPRGTRLKNGVTFSVRFQNGPVIYTDGDVTSAELIRLSPQGTVEKVFFGLPAEVEKRWQRLAAKIQQEDLAIATPRPVLYTFTNEIDEQLEYWHAHSAPRAFDVSALGKTEEQFVADYLEMPLRE